MTAHERIRQAARDGLSNWYSSRNRIPSPYLDEAADATADEICRQLRQRPLMPPTDEQLQYLISLAPDGLEGHDLTRWVFSEFQHRYLFSEEPEVPENIKDLLLESVSDGDTCLAVNSNQRVIEAERHGFERGQHAKEQG